MLPETDKIVSCIFFTTGSNPRGDILPASKQLGATFHDQYKADGYCVVYRQETAGSHSAKQCTFCSHCAQAAHSSL
jgi:hypothetical protein